MDAFSSALDLAAAVRRKEVSPVELAELYLGRIDRLNPVLNSVCFRDDDRVLAAARQAANLVATQPADDLPPFCGVPLPIKDLNRVAGWPTSYGSRGASPEPNQMNDVVVDRFLEAGFVLLGMTTSPELGTISFTESERWGITRNPWNTDHTTGGSSGGAAATVASGMAPVAHASDGGGSIRIPASCCGLVGLKPSRNRVPNGYNEMEGFTTSGVVTRTVADTAAILDQIGRPDPLGWHNAPPPLRPFATQATDRPRLRIGVTTTPPVEVPVDPACLEAVQRTAELLAGLGHEVSEATLSLTDADRFVAAFMTVWNTGSAGAPLDPAQLEPLNATLRAAGQALDSISYVEAVMTTQLLARPLMAQFGDAFDVLLTPTMATQPPRCESVWEGADLDPTMPLLKCYPMAVFTSVWNVTGLPALSLPLHVAESGLPVGVQLVGGPWQDGLLLALGSQLEEAAPWIDRRPPVS